jgi:hypothetical protein
MARPINRVQRRLQAERHDQLNARLGENAGNQLTKHFNGLSLPVAPSQREVAARYEQTKNEKGER